MLGPLVVAVAVAFVHAARRVITVVTLVVLAAVSEAVGADGKGAARKRAGLLLADMGGEGDSGAGAALEAEDVVDQSGPVLPCPPLAAAAAAAAAAALASPAEDRGLALEPFTTSNNQEGRSPYYGIGDKVADFVKRYKDMQEELTETKQRLAAAEDYKAKYEELKAEMDDILGNA